MISYSEQWTTWNIEEAKAIGAQFFRAKKDCSSCGTRITNTETGKCDKCGMRRVYEENIVI